MKRYIALFLSLVCIVTVAGCNNAPNPGSIGYSKPITAVIQGDVTMVNVKHIVGGQITKSTVKGSSLDELRAWTDGLKYEHKTFAKGNTPGDTDGGESYIFEITEGDYPGFSYIINGDNDCYLLIESEWYSVTNPSTPPIDNLSNLNIEPTVLISVTSGGETITPHMLLL